MAPVLSFLLSSGFKKKEPRYVRLTEDNSSHSHTMGLRFTPQSYFLHVGLLLSPLCEDVFSGCYVQ